MRSVDLEGTATAASPASHAPDTLQLFIVTPVYEDRDAATRLFAALGQLYPTRCHIYAVDDGSTREPVQVDWIEAARLPGAVLRLKRNVGHQRAIAAGLAYVSRMVGQHARVVVMDSDGEDAPGSIQELVDVLESDSVDMVVATRRSRVETWRFKAFYVVYRALFRLLAGRSLAFGNFMVLKPAAARRLAAMGELGIHVAASALNSKLRIVHRPIDRASRYAGRSKMNFVGLALHGFKAMMVFSEDILVRVGVACTIVALLSIIGALVAVGLKLVGYATPGWFSIAVGVLFLVFLQTGATTLMSLMLAGSLKTAVASVRHEDLIDAVIETR